MVEPAPSPSLLETIISKVGPASLVGRRMQGISLFSGIAALELGVSEWQPHFLFRDAKFSAHAYKLKHWQFFVGSSSHSATCCAHFFSGSGDCSALLCMFDLVTWHRTWGWMQQGVSRNSEKQNGGGPAANWADSLRHSDFQSQQICQRSSWMHDRRISLSSFLMKFINKSFITSWTAWLHDLRLHVLFSCTKGASSAGGMLGLDDARTALVREVFNTMDKCPRMCLVLQNLIFMFIVFMLSFDVVPSVACLLLSTAIWKEMMRELVLLENVKNLFAPKLRPLWDYVRQARGAWQWLTSFYVALWHPPRHLNLCRNSEGGVSHCGGASYPAVIAASMLGAKFWCSN